MNIEVLVVVDDARCRVENTRQHVRAVFVHERKGVNDIRKAAFGCSWTATDFAWSPEISEGKMMVVVADLNATGIS